MYLHRKRIVLASNVWHSSMKCLSPDDQAWLVANTVLVEVDAPMWVLDS